LLILNHPPTPFFEKEGGLTQVFPLFFKEGTGVIEDRKMGGSGHKWKKQPKTSTRVLLAELTNRTRVVLSKQRDLAISGRNNHISTKFQKM
jgi:hypothetical protein